MINQRYYCYIYKLGKMPRISGVHSQFTDDVNWPTMSEQSLSAGGMCEVPVQAQYMSAKAGGRY